MSLTEVARKDLLGARRTKSLWTVLLLLGGIGALFGYAIVTSSGEAATNPDAIRATVTNLFRTYAFLLSAVVPIVALIIGYQAIAGERDSGGIVFLLSLPNGRGDVFFGKLLSRTLLVTLGVLVSFAAVLVALVGDLAASAAPVAIPIGRIAGIVAISVVYAATFTVIAVAVSSAFASRRRAVGGAVGAYFLTVVSYLLPAVSLSGIVRTIHTDLLGASPNPDLYAFANFTSPFVAVRKFFNLVLPADAEFTVLRLAVAARTNGGTEATAPADVTLPWFLSDAFAPVVFAAWLVVPVAVGFLRFRRADLP